MTNRIAAMEARKQTLETQIHLLKQEEHTRLGDILTEHLQMEWDFLQECIEEERASA